MIDTFLTRRACPAPVSGNTLPLAATPSLPDSARRSVVATVVAAALSLGGVAHAQSQPLPLPLSGAAYRVAQEAYAAYGRGDYTTAVDDAREAIRQRPDVASLRLLLANALAAQRRYGDAGHALDEGLSQVGRNPALLARRKQIDALAASMHAVGSNARPLPGDANALTGAALTAAQQAYKAYDAKDFPATVRYANQAIALRPDLLRLRLLLIDAASAAGQDADAWNADLDAVKRFGDNDDLRLRRSFIGSRLAPKVSAESFAARKQGDYATAVTLARRTVDYAPDQVGYRVQLIDTLLATNDLAGAEAAAGDAIAADDTEIMPLTLRGYVRAAQGKTAQADADFAKAQQAQDATQRNQRVARVIIADVWIAEGQPQRALDLLAPLKTAGDETDPPIALRRAEARRLLAKPPGGLSQQTRLVGTTGAPADGAAAPAMAAQAIDPARRPVIDCIVDQFGASCDVYAADPGFAAARASATAAAANDNTGAVGYAREAVKAAPNDPQHRVELINALSTAGDDKGATREARQMVDAGMLDAMPDLSAAYIAQRAGDNRLAYRRFQQADAAGKLPASANADAGYAALQAHRNRDAAHYFERVIDANEAPGNAPGNGAGVAGASAPSGASAASPVTAASGAAASGASTRAATATPAATTPATPASTAAAKLPAAAGATAATVTTDSADDDNPHLSPAALNDIRNAHADVTRNWGFDVSVNYRGAGLQPGFSSATPSAGTSNNWQSGVEAYWRPFGSLGDRLFEVYARGYENFGVKGGSPSGVDTLQAAVGARAKPFAQIDAIVAVERIIPIGSSVNPDWLGRLAYSGGFGTERRIDVPSWWTAQIYAEGGYYLNAATGYATTNLELGRTFRMDRYSPKWTVFPYAVIGADYDSSVDHSIPVGAGVGISTRYWMRDSKYDAPRSFIDLSVQYRFKITGDDRARGVFFGATYSY